jgi:hypothetical protein
MPADVFSMRVVLIDTSEPFAVHVRAGPAFGSRALAFSPILKPSSAGRIREAGRRDELLQRLRRPDFELGPA